MSHLTTYPLSMSLSHYQPASLLRAGDPELSLKERVALALRVEAENKIFLLTYTPWGRLGLAAGGGGGGGGGRVLGLLDLDPRHR